MLHARLGDRTFELAREGDALTLDGEPLDARLDPLGPDTYLLVLEGQPRVLTVERAGEHARVTLGGTTLEVTLKDETALLLERFGFEDDASAAEREIRAPMPGLVLHVLVEPGQAVEEGQGLVVLEAMKMENELRAAAAGTVAAIYAEPGAAVGKGDLLVELE